MVRPSVAPLVGNVLSWIFVLYFAAACDAQLLEVHFMDKDSGDPVACRVEGKKAPKRFPKPSGSLVSGSTILFEGSTKLKPGAGDFQFDASKGIEYADVFAGFTMQKDANSQFDVLLEHRVDMNALGWFSGDLASSLPTEKLSRWAAADGINLAASTDAATAIADVGPLPDSQNFHTCWPAYRFSCGVDGARLTVFPQARATALPDSFVEIDRSDMTQWLPLVAALESQQWTFELSNLNARDVPLLLAVLPIHAAQILSPELQPNREGDVAKAFFNPDPIRFGKRHGLARLNEFLYWQMLEAGFKITPTAATNFASDGKTHLGYNRVYVHLDSDQDVTPEQWWANLVAGQTIVTNGPVLRATVNGRPAGETITGYSAAPRGSDLQVDMIVRDEVDYLDVIYNGQPMYQARLEDHLRRGQFPPLPIDHSGWLIMRVVTAHEASYRLAATAPTYYVIDGKPRIDRAAVRIFQDWLRLAKEDIQRDAQHGAAMQPWINKADQVWTRLALEAN